MAARTADGGRSRRMPESGHGKNRQPVTWSARMAREAVRKGLYGKQDARSKRGRAGDFCSNSAGAVRCAGATASTPRGASGPSLRPGRRALPHRCRMRKRAAAVNNNLWFSTRKRAAQRSITCMAGCKTSVEYIDCLCLSQNTGYQMCVSKRVVSVAVVSVLIAACACLQRVWSRFDQKPAYRRRASRLAASGRRGRVSGL